MYYKLSNNFVVDDIEDLGCLKFKFPDAFRSKPIIDGSNEEILPVITDQNEHKIDFAIWGLLPQDFKEDWSVFQSTGNTLNMHITDVIDDPNYNEVLRNRRCCILISGFFASYYSGGEVFPIYVYSSSTPIFTLAAMYNLTNDGFLTTTVLLKDTNKYMSKLHNVSKRMPIPLSVENMHSWLGEDFRAIAQNNVDNFSDLDIKSHSIAKEFYKNNIVYDSILEPVHYENLSINF